MNTHIIYIPGLGDRYDTSRARALRYWNTNGVTAELLPMRWRDLNESMDQKIDRLHQRINQLPDSRIVLVGESAGGSVVVSQVLQKNSRITKGITICGKNIRADRVSPYLYKKNPAFEDSMRRADMAVQSYPEHAHKLVIFYSMSDPVVRPLDTIVAGAHSRKLKTTGHLFSIFIVLFFLKRRIIKEATSQT